MDVLDRADLPFPHSLPEFQRLFPDDAACAAYLEKARWGDGFACPHCGTAGEPFHFENRPGVLRCRKCRQNTGLTVGTVMERSHTPLNVWFWAAYLVASQTPGMSAVQFQRQLGLSRYETAFQILHKLRSGMVRPNQDRIGGQPKNHVEVDETWVGGRTRGEGRGVHHKLPGSYLTDLQHPWRRIRARAELPDVRIHDLRHSFASRALALGEGLPMIGKLLGHTQVQTTARYAHLARDTVEASAARIGDSIDNDLDAA